MRGPLGGVRPRGSSWTRVPAGSAPALGVGSAGVPAVGGSAKSRPPTSGPVSSAVTRSAVSLSESVQAVVGALGDQVVGADAEQGDRGEHRGRRRQRDPRLEPHALSPERSWRST